MAHNGEYPIMHLKKLVKKNHFWYIEHYVIIDAIDGSDKYLEELTIKNCWKYIPEIIRQLLRMSR